MKVIGIDANGDYIAVVGHSELEKVVDKYYGNLKKLLPGSDFNLGAGYDFRSDIQSACKGMIDADKNFDRAKKTLHRFAVMVAAFPADESAEAQP